MQGPSRGGQGHQGGLRRPQQLDPSIPLSIRVTGPIGKAAVTSQAARHRAPPKPDLPDQIVGARRHHHHEAGTIHKRGFKRTHSLDLQSIHQPAPHSENGQASGLISHTHTHTPRNFPLCFHPPFWPRGEEGSPWVSRLDAQACGRSAPHCRAAQTCMHHQHMRAPTPHGKMGGDPGSVACIGILDLPSASP